MRPDMYGGEGGQMKGAHLHECRCLRRRQRRLFFIPSTLSRVLGPASTHGTSNPTPQAPH